MPDTIDISAGNGESPRPSGLGQKDILFIIFRRKWLIISCCLLGLISAVATYFLFPRTYISRAGLLIRYVMDTRPMNPANPGDTQVRTPDSRGDNILNSEAEILSSLDLATQVADQGLAEKVLAKLGGGSDTNKAGLAIKSGLTVDVPRKTDVIVLTFQHPDPSVVQPVLNRLINTYIQRHAEIHRGVGVADSAYQAKRDRFKNDLAAAEENLKKLRTENQIITLDDSKRSYSDQINRLTADIITTEALLAEQKALYGMGTNELSPGTAVNGGTNTTVQTNSPKAVAEVVVPVEITRTYNVLMAEYETLLKEEAVALAKFRDTHPNVVQIRNRLSEITAKKAELEKVYPGLHATRLAMDDSLRKSDRTAGTEAGSDPVLRINAIQARLSTLRARLASIQSDSSKLADLEPLIQRQMRDRDLYEAGYRYFASAASQLESSDPLKGEGIRNIGIVQSATPPAQEMKRLLQVCGGLLGGGIVLGFGLAFLIELVFRPSLQRGADIERSMQVPVFLTVPHTEQREVSMTGPGTDPAAGDVPAADGKETSLMTLGPNKAAPWDPEHELFDYCEALRDRLITHFDLKKLTHKPKLVAVTSCDRGAGVTTLATGLAASLSETGDGNVLLVDMSGPEGAAHPFSRGKPLSGLTKALKSDERTKAVVHENLYLATAHEVNMNRDELPKALPRRFAKLIPELKASDFDYIIFDMPAVSQTSVTARLSRYMDMVLMVIASGETSPDKALRAKAVLQESGTGELAAVINKSVKVLPSSLEHDM